MTPNPVTGVTVRQARDHLISLPSNVLKRIPNGASGQLTWHSSSAVVHFTRVGKSLTLEHDGVSYVLPASERQVGCARQVLWRCLGCAKTVRIVHLPTSGTRFMCRECHELTRPWESPQDRLIRRWLQTYDTLDSADATTQQKLKAGVLIDELNQRLMVPDDTTQRQRERLKRRFAPRRPSGRPRLHQRYQRHKPWSVSPRTTETQHWCPRERDLREMVSPHMVTYSNGAKAVRGICATCGATMSRMLPRRQTSEDLT